MTAGADLTEPVQEQDQNTGEKVCPADQAEFLGSVGEQGNNYIQKIAKKGKQYGKVPLPLPSLFPKEREHRLQGISQQRKEGQKQKLPEQRGKGTENFRAGCIKEDQQQCSNDWCQRAFTDHDRSISVHTAVPLSCVQYGG